MNFQVREAKIEDLEEVVDLWRTLSAGQLGKDPYYRGSIEFNSGHKQLQNSIESSDCGIFVIEYEGRIQGFIEVWKQTESYQIEKERCAYIVHCIYDNQYKKSNQAFHVVACLYRAAENWAIENGMEYLTADVFEHNKMVAKFLGRADVLPYKYRMVRKI